MREGTYSCKPRHTIVQLNAHTLKLLNRDFTCTLYNSDIKSNRQTNLEQKQIVPLYHY